MPANGGPYECGKDTIDHPPGAHNDIANVVAGVAHCAVNRHTVTVTKLRI
jgi:hypothetical protein